MSDDICSCPILPQIIILCILLSMILQTMFNKVVMVDINHQ